MDATRQKALVRASTVVHKKEEEKKGKKGASLSTSKAAGKGAPKRKNDKKDDCPSKKPSITFGEKQPKKSSPPKSSHGASKSLMTSSGPVTQGTHCLLTHKGYAIKMVESIIKQMDVDPCAE